MVIDQKKLDGFDQNNGQLDIRTASQNITF
jgi:hypothetical protein